MANADGYVLPKPGVPKTLGILNVIFGVLMILYGLCMIGILAASAPMMQFAEKTVKEAQSKVQNQQQAQLKGFDDREKAASTEEEKKAIQQEREAHIASTPKMPNFDMGAATAVIKDPVVMGFSYLQMGSGVLLSVLLMISGIGLIRLATWGRSTAIAFAGLQIVQLVVVSAASILYVQPIQAAAQEKMLAKMEDDAKAPGAAPGAAESVKLARAMSGSGTTMIFSLGYVVLGSIYPIVLLALLNSAGARAALQGPQQSGPADF